MNVYVYKRKKRKRNDLLGMILKYTNDVYIVWVRLKLTLLHSAIGQDREEESIRDLGFRC